MSRNEKGRFDKTNEPWNKGLKGFCPSPDTMFKEGQYHGENHPSWKGGIQMPQNDCAHQYIGIGKRVRRPRAVYEQHHGEIPSGYVIIHIDGNKYNDSIENLKAVSRGELLKMNSKQKK